MRKIKNYLMSKICFLQYLSGLKKHNYIKKIWKEYLIYKNKQEDKIHCESSMIPIPDLKNYNRTIKKFIYAEPKNSEVVIEFLNANIKIVKEKFNYTSVNNNDVVLVCVIKNDIFKIKEFMEYYRKIGIKYFAFIDNNSMDGTFEFLKEQNDVNLYSTIDDYSTKRREGWLNRLYSYIGFNKWILCVDSDELFTYIEQERYKINDFIKKIGKSEKRIRTLLLDMYSNKNLFEKCNVDSFEKEYCYFDKDSYWIENSYRSQMIFGGPRGRMFSDNETTFKCALSKFPLFFYEYGDFQGSSHWSYPYIKNKKEISAVLRHYKFTDKDMEKYKERVIKGNYSCDSAEYKKYFEILSNNNDISFYNKHSRKYINSKDLGQINILGKEIKNIFIS